MFTKFQISIDSLIFFICLEIKTDSRMPTYITRNYTTKKGFSLGFIRIQINSCKTFGIEASRPLLKSSVQSVTTRPWYLRLFDCLSQLGVKNMSMTFKSNELIAECVYRYVITMELCRKYDVVGHYFRFAVRFLANP